MAEDVAEGKIDVSEVSSQQPGFRRSGSEVGATPIPGNERVLPSRLEQLIRLCQHASGDTPVYAEMCLVFIEV